MVNTKKLILALAAIGVTMGILWFTHRTVTPGKATWTDVETEAKNGKYRLITTDALSRKYQNDPHEILLVDTRQEWEYRTGHIQGALNFPMEPTWLSRWRNKGALKSFLGTDKNRLIVFY
jgi:3-mercaptopyruvate sulfurtransferase SseA